MQQHRVHPPGQRLRPRRLADGNADDTIRLALGGAQIGRGRRLQVLAEPGPEAPAAMASMRRSRSSVPPRRTATEVTTGAPSSFDSLTEIDVDAAPAGDVDHIEHEHQRTADPLELDHQAQRDAQIGGIGDAQQQVGRGFARQPAEHDVAGDLFVGAAPAQRIGAGQIDQVDAMAARRLDDAALAFDGDARIVGDFLPAAGERIEQRGLAAIRRPHQGKSPSVRFACSRHGIGSCQATRTAIASRRRSAMVVSLTRTAIGSRPSGPSCRISTWAPSTKPSSSRRRSSSAALPLNAASALAMVSMRPRNPLRAKPKGACRRLGRRTVAAHDAVLHMIMISTIIWRTP